MINKMNKIEITIEENDRSCSIAIGITYDELDNKTLNTGNFMTQMSKLLSHSEVPKYTIVGFYCVKPNVDITEFTDDEIVLFFKNIVLSESKIKILDSLPESDILYLYDKTKNLKGGLVDYLYKRLRPKRIEDLLN